jgi:dCTP deaminase
MSVLPDLEIERWIKEGVIRVDPYRPEHLQPASLDVCLSSAFRRYATPQTIGAVDPARNILPDTQIVGVGKDGTYYLPPGGFVLGCLQETLTLPAYVVARLDGKSSLGRLGLIVHATAGFVDPGWDGRLTLEMANVSPMPIILRPGMKIAQLSFMILTSPCRRPYGSPGLGSSYQGQTEPAASRYGGQTPDTAVPETGAAPWLTAATLRAWFETRCGERVDAENLEAAAQFEERLWGTLRQQREAFDRLNTGWAERLAGASGNYASAPDWSAGRCSYAQLHPEDPGELGRCHAHTNASRCGNCQQEHGHVGPHMDSVGYQWK